MRALPGLQSPAAQQGLRSAVHGHFVVLAALALDLYRLATLVAHAGGPRQRGTSQVGPRLAVATEVDADFHNPDRSWKTNREFLRDQFGIMVEVREETVTVKEITLIDAK